MRWDFVQLGELYEVHNGLSKGRQFFGRGYPFLSFSTVFNNWFLPKKLPDLVQSSDKERESYSILRGDVFITRTSETMDELGMSSVALMDYPNATYNGFTKRLRPIDNKRILPEYIGYYLRCNEFRNKFIAFSTMTTRASLRNEDLLSIKVPVPPLETQRRIADILSAYDDLIENNRKQIKLLEEAAQRLYKEWFVDLRFPGHEHTRIVDGVPEGWKIRAVSDFGKVVTGKTPSTSKPEYYDGNIPFVTIPDMHNTIFPLSTEKHLSEQGANMQKSKFLPPNSVMVSCIATVGLVSITSQQCQTNQQINSVVLKNEIDLYFLYFAMKRIKSLLDGVGSNGATMTNVNKMKFENINILYPESHLINCFFEFSMPVFRKILILSKENLQLQQVRDRLLPKLMSGEVKT